MKEVISALSLPAAVVCVAVWISLLKEGRAKERRLREMLLKAMDAMMQVTNRMLEKRRQEEEDEKPKEIEWEKVDVPEATLEAYFARVPPSASDVPIAVARQVREEAMAKMVREGMIGELAVYKGMLEAMDRFVKVYRTACEMYSSKHVSAGGRISGEERE